MEFYLVTLFFTTTLRTVRLSKMILRIISSFLLNLHGENIVAKIATNFCNVEPYGNYDRNYYVRCSFW